ncbi:LLM class flavin-dependent oxidoreductase [Virgisporangium aurantiacum]|uniref:Luciferase n=1 Tax=Virgisporangium aurantiacum TaxID=175570 RepID=A0A8J3Z461_9ACTN|nr:LLM class flavin-dependent oxidoreductase [Virgisporangium aurantiacum]GIJ55968.1 luciferase [Virgisporangium aurantiacum]
MRIGVLVLPTDPFPAARDQVRRLESLGYDSLWTYDHLSWRRYRDKPWFAAVPWLTGMAAATSRIRLGTMVASPNFRHPVTFAKEAMTLDHVSAGRLTLGLGAGGIGFDATVLGGEVLTPRQRVDRLTEFVDVLDTLLRRPETSHRGAHYTVDGAMMLPGCVQQPRIPLAIAAGGARSLKLVARYGDAWISDGDEDGEKAVLEKVKLLAEHCDAIGRDPAGIERIMLIGNTSERPLASLDAFTDFVGRYGDLGFTEVVFHHPRSDDPVWTEDPAIVEQIADAYFDRAPSQPNMRS